MVSVIITSYKRPVEIVERAVASVLAQTYTDLEVLIVDDNVDNSPESSELAQTFSNKDRIRYIKQDGNKGACAARNLGIKEAKGEFVAFLDDDDTWEKDKLEVQLARFEGTDESVGMVYCLGDVIVCTTNPPTVEEYYTTRMYKDEITFQDQLKYDYIGSTSQALIRKSCIVALGGFDESLPARQDYEMWLRISKDYRILGVNKVLFHYYQHDLVQITKSPKKALTGYRIVYKKYKKYYLENKAAHIGLLERMMQEVKGHYKVLYQYYRIKKHLLMAMEK